MPHPTHLHYGRQVFQCDYCGYARVGNEAAVAEHEAEKHPPTVEVSPIVDAEGRSIVTVTAPDGARRIER